MIDEIRSKPASDRAWIGVTFESIAGAAAAVQIGLQPNTRGAVVVAVFSASPGVEGRPEARATSSSRSTAGGALVPDMSKASTRSNRATRSCSTSSTAPGHGVRP